MHGIAVEFQKGLVGVDGMKVGRPDDHGHASGFQNLLENMQIRFNARGRPKYLIRLFIHCAFNGWCRFKLDHTGIKRSAVGF